MIQRVTQRPWALMLVVLLLTARLAYADEPEKTDGGGAAASDPTAAVSYQDLKLRYFNLTKGNEESIMEAEGSYVFSPAFKLTHKLVGTRTNRSGEGRMDQGSRQDPGRNGNGHGPDCTLSRHWLVAHRR
jgi:hypothetical protein